MVATFADRGRRLPFSVFPVAGHSGPDLDSVSGYTGRASHLSSSGESASRTDGGDRRRNPQARTSSGVYEFEMNQPIPSYLIALAVGDLEFRRSGRPAGSTLNPA